MAHVATLDEQAEREEELRRLGLVVMRSNRAVRVCVQQMKERVARIRQIVGDAPAVHGLEQNVKFLIDHTENELRDELERKRKRTETHTEVAVPPSKRVMPSLKPSDVVRLLYDTKRCGPRALADTKVVDFFSTHEQAVDRLAEWVEHHTPKLDLKVSYERRKPRDHPQTTLRLVFASPDKALQIVVNHTLLHPGKSNPNHLEPNGSSRVSVYLDKQCAMTGELKEKPPGSTPVWSYDLPRIPVVLTAETEKEYSLLSYAPEPDAFGTTFSVHRVLKLFLYAFHLESLAPPSTLLPVDELRKISEFLVDNAFPSTI
jgi:hypothetical protein